jgi:hypothetical protein
MDGILARSEPQTIRRVCVPHGHVPLLAGHELLRDARLRGRLRRRSRLHVRGSRLPEEAPVRGGRRPRRRGGARPSDLRELRRARSPRRPRGDVGENYRGCAAGGLRSPVAARRGGGRSHHLVGAARCPGRAGTNDRHLGRHPVPPTRPAIAPESSVPRHAGLLPAGRLAECSRGGARGIRHPHVAEGHARRPEGAVLGNRRRVAAPDRGRRRPLARRAVRARPAPGHHVPSPPHPLRPGSDRRGAEERARSGGGHADAAGRSRLPRAQVLAELGIAEAELRRRGGRRQGRRPGSGTPAGRHSADRGRGRALDQPLVPGHAGCELPPGCRSTGPGTRRVRLPGHRSRLPRRAAHHHRKHRARSGRRRFMEPDPGCARPSGPRRGLLLIRPSGVSTSAGHFRCSAADAGCRRPPGIHRRLRCRRPERLHTHRGGSGSAFPVASGVAVSRVALRARGGGLAVGPPLTSVRLRSPPRRARTGVRGRGRLADGDRAGCSRAQVGRLGRPRTVRDRHVFRVPRAPDPPGARRGRRSGQADLNRGQRERVPPPRPPGEDRLGSCGGSRPASTRAGP